MQYSTALSFYLLALAGPASVFAQVEMMTVWDQATTIITVTAGQPAPTPPANNPPAVEEKVAEAPSPAAPSPPPPPPAPSPAAPSGGGGKNDGQPGKLQSHDGQICINFSGNDDFHFLNTGSWGTKSGAGTQDASQCFSPSANAGMFICESECQDSGDSSTAKYTKLECTLGGQYQNCDISLVDGFSLPLKCTIPGAEPEDWIGGLTDLSAATSCPSTGDDNTCKNSNAYEAAESAVPPYFEAAVFDKNKQNNTDNYCVFQKCEDYSDIFFTDSVTIECEVGYRGAASPSTSKRNILSQRETGEISTRTSRGRRHSHGSAHARGLKDLAI